MINIILDSEQERLLQEQLKTGKYTTPSQVITEALKALAEKQSVNEPQQLLTLVSGEPAQKLLEEKIKMMQKLKKTGKQDPHRQALAEDFRKLCEETQALQGNNPLTEEEIVEEIAAYRRGE